MVSRGLDHDRLEDASAAREAESTVTSLDGEISRLEAELAHLREYDDDDREAPERTPAVSSFGGGRASDSYPGR